MPLRGIEEYEASCVQPGHLVHVQLVCLPVTFDRAGIITKFYGCWCNMERAILSPATGARQSSVPHILLSHRQRDLVWHGWPQAWGSALWQVCCRADGVQLDRMPGAHCCCSFLSCCAHACPVTWLCPSHSGCCHHAACKSCMQG